MLGEIVVLFEKDDSIPVWTMSPTMGNIHLNKFVGDFSSEDIGLVVQVEGGTTQMLTKFGLCWIVTWAVVPLFCKQRARVSPF